MQSLVNMYAEQVENEGRTDVVCYPSPGKALFATIGGGIPRGAITAAGIQYEVIGTRFYKISSGGVSTDLGEIEGSKMVDMTFNGVQLSIVAELKSYAYDTISLILAEISDPNFEQAGTCASLNSYDAFGVLGTGRFRWRLVNTATFSANDFATAEAESDNLRCIRKVGNELALLGDTSLEWWYSTGDSGANAFAKTSTAAKPIGCVSRDAVNVVDGGLTFVGRDGTAGGVSVYRAEGYEPRKISNPQVDGYLETVSDLTTLNSFTYQQRGHLFYVLRSPSEWALAWDVSTNQWSYRKSGLFSMGADPLGGWDAVTFALNGSKQIVGASDGNLYELQVDTYTEAGAGIIREVTTPQYHKDGKRLFVRRVELDIEAGVGLTTGQGSAPIVMMSMSYDGGKTWTNPREASMGAIGQYKFRAAWGAGGSGRKVMFKFRVSDPVKVVFLGCFADIMVGAH